MIIENLFPLIVPSSYLDTGWDLPNQKFPIAEFILTWVEFEGSYSMTYLTEIEYRDINSSISNWQRRSFENLRNSGQYFHTHSKVRDNADHLIYLSFLNEDGIGSSRILLNMELAKGFPNGYYLAFPDRSCGLAISKDITDEELKETQLLIGRMFKNATTPMTGEIYSSKDFALHTKW